jgi:para-nitrobenzyl esterase
MRRVPGVGRAALDALTVQVTRRIFAAPAARLADAQARGGAGVYRYRFDWAPPSGGFGACHTIDLPFVLGDRESWGDAPMLGGVPWEAVDALGRQVRRAWTTFARHGDPSLDGGQPWPKHRPGEAVGRVFV